jgi:hypothetical protein
MVVLSRMTGWDCLVGVDGGERREQGYSGKLGGMNIRKVARIRSTHGSEVLRNSTVKRVEGVTGVKGVTGERGVSRAPRRSGVESNYRQVTMEGERRETKKIKGMYKKHMKMWVGEKGAGKRKGVVLGEQISATQEVCGVWEGWGTRRVANRYDRLREGHMVNRRSGARAKISVERMREFV